MKYLIVQDWESTSGNHAGMVHMCNLLKDRFSTEYTVLKIPVNLLFSSNLFIKFAQKVIKKINYNYFWFLQYRKLCKPYLNKIKNDDENFLLEYCFPQVPQYKIAIYLRRKFPNIKIYALSHLSPSYFKNENVYANMVRKWSIPIDKMLTLGSSLSSFFGNCGIDATKISTGFHYVDKVYYHNPDPLKENQRIRLIAIGNMQRNFSLLKEICLSTPNVEWIICKGKSNIDYLFTGYENVTLKGYLTEDELKAEMSKADISINIMYDTIGSNVITTSMAMGLAIISSNVGSIKDYCNERNSILCDNELNSFVKAINYLDQNRNVLLSMKKESIKLSQRFSIEKINEWFCSL